MPVDPIPRLSRVPGILRSFGKIYQGHAKEKGWPHPSALYATWGRQIVDGETWNPFRSHAASLSAGKEETKLNNPAFRHFLSSRDIPPSPSLFLSHRMKDEKSWSLSGPPRTTEPAPSPPVEGWMPDADIRRERSHRSTSIRVVRCSPTAKEQ